MAEKIENKLTSQLAFDFLCHKQFLLKISVQGTCLLLSYQKIFPKQQIMSNLFS